MRFLAQNIFQELKKLDPKYVIDYVNRASMVQDELALVERQLNEAVISMPKDRRSFIVFHPTYGYLAKDFKLKQYTIEVNGKEPKPRDLANLVKVGRKDGVKIVFVQPQFSKRAAETIAKELGAVVVETDPLSADFIGNTQKFIKAIKEGGKK